jgi:hypothetical protein
LRRFVLAHIGNLSSRAGNGRISLSLHKFC